MKTVLTPITMINRSRGVCLFVPLTLGEHYKKKLFLEGPLVSSLTGTSALIRPVEVATTSCDARNCILDRFKGRKVDWIQCDSCDK